MKFRVNWVNHLGHRVTSALALGFLSLFLTGTPILAAGKILFFFGPFGRSLQIASLTAFAKDGTIAPDLRLYLRGTTPEERAELRRVLTTTASIDPVLLSRFFNSPMGESLLKRLGALLTIQGGINGEFALRAALVQGAFQTGGFTPLAFLQNLPTNMQVNGEKVLALAKQVGLLVKATQYFTAAVADLSAIEAAREGDVNFSRLPDLRRGGSYRVEEKRLELTDKTRHREFYVLIFEPETPDSQKIPVIVFSHGLASRPEDYAGEARYWASYGFLVALPQHPDSDLTRLQDLIEGLSGQVFGNNEFIDRPLDLRFTIDELERRNASEYGGRLDLENVGVGGHSFGGYAALALAGARIDFPYLEKECQREFDYLDISRLLQCRALALPRKEYDFRDPRVKAVFAANPVNNSIFGPSGLKQVTIPVFLAAGTYDPATPAVVEQVRSFPWLGSKERYLALIEGQAHVDFAVLDPAIAQTIESISDLTLPSPSLLDTYVNALSLSFFEIYIRSDASYRPFLQAAFAKYLSEGQKFRCFLIGDASLDGLVKAMEDFPYR